jgi:hypothetical protein
VRIVKRAGNYAPEASITETVFGRYSESGMDLPILVRVSGKARELWAGCGALALILIAQSMWLLPELSARTQQIIAGVEPPPSYAHGAYSILELSKLLLLLYLGFRSMQMLQGGTKTSIPDSKN